MSVLVQTEEEGIVTLTLNRPEVLNALNRELVAALTDTIRALEKRNDVRVLIITGAGEKAFSVGADLKEMRNAMENKRGIPLGGGRWFKIPDDLEQLPFPVLCAIGGYAMAGGLELALGADLRIATDNSTFAFPEIRLGFFPGGGAPVRLPRLIPPSRAKELLFSGRRFSANEALNLNLVDFVVPQSELLPKTYEIARNLLHSSPLGLRAIKILINEGMQMDIAKASMLSDALRKPLNHTEDYKEGLRAFIEKRLPKFTGC